MKSTQTVRRAALFALLILSLSAVTWAQEDAPSAKQPQRQRARQNRSGADLRQEIHKAIRPTPEQEKQLQQIWTTHQQEMQNWRSQNEEKIKALREKMQAAQKSGDRQAVQGIAKELKELQTGRDAAIENLKKQLGDVLSKEQMQKALEMINRQRGSRQGGPMQALRQLKLSEEQNAKVKAIMDEVAVQVQKTGDEKIKRQLMDEAMEKIKATVLTEEQKQALAKATPQRRQPFADMGLDEKQKSQAKTILDEAREKAKAAKTDEERRNIMQQAMQKVHETVLTEQQRAKVVEQRSPLKRLGATAEQQAKSDEIMAAARKAAEAAKTPEEKREIIRAAMKKVHDEVLTDEQREKIKQFRQNRRGGQDGQPRQRRQTNPAENMAPAAN